MQQKNGNILSTPVRTSHLSGQSWYFTATIPAHNSVLAIIADEATAQENLALDNNYAQALVKAGYLVGVFECNYVPGILTLAEMGDIAALIAPRPLCVLNGENDELYPVEHAYQQLEIVRRAYDLHDSSQACQLRIHTGGHAYNNEVSRDCFLKWLK